MTRRQFDLDEVDERLREWAHYFRDIKSAGHCRSIEHRFRATSDDFAAEGWGDEESAPRALPARSYSLRSALQTHDAIQQLDRIYKWALTYGYCYPGLPKFVVLRCMKRYANRRLNWRGYLEVLDIGRMRVHTTRIGADRLTA